MGVTQFGEANSPFLNPSGYLAVPSGSYFLLMGFEYYWMGSVPASTVTLSVGYADGSNRQAVFDNGSVTTNSTWTRLSGDSSLLLGCAGFTNVDRIGNVSFGPNGADDIILKFSDAGSFPAPVFQSLSQTNGILTLTWSGEVSSVYQLQSSTNLAQTNWANLGTSITATATNTMASDALGAEPCKFYRVVQTP